MEAITKHATALGGSIGGVTVYTGEMQVRNATLELKVPAQRFDAAGEAVEIWGWAWADGCPTATCRTLSPPRFRSFGFTNALVMRAAPWLS